MSDTGNSGTPPGWYPDNEGNPRYWDGSGWTEHVQGSSPSGSTAANSTQAHPPAPPQAPGDTRAYTDAAKASRPWFKKKRWWLAIAVVVLIAGSALGGSADESPTASEGAGSGGTDDTPSKSEPSKAEAAKPKAKPKPKALQVKAETIVKEFEENEFAADNKYKGKTLKITGVVDKIDTELFNDKKYILQIGGGGDYEFLTVNCHDMSSDELSTLGKGKSVVVVGKFDDGGDLGVEVNDCELA